jgi:hypothetical protein
VAQLGQRTCFGSRGSPVQIRPSRPPARTPCSAGVPTAPHSADRSMTRVPGPSRPHRRRPVPRPLLRGTRQADPRPPATPRAHPGLHRRPARSLEAGDRPYPLPESPRLRQVGGRRGRPPGQPHGRQEAVGWSGLRAGSGDGEGVTLPRDGRADRQLRGHVRPCASYASHRQTLAGIRWGRVPRSTAPWLAGALLI